MCCSKNFSPTYFFILLLNLVLFFSQSACSPIQRNGVIQAGQTFSTELDKALEEPSELVFAGQIEDENGRWLNDYIVVLFKNGAEITRTTSRLMESSFSDKGPMDGVFELRIANVYKLTLAHDFYQPNRKLINMRTAPGVVGTRALGTWFDALNPKELRVLDIPEKQLEYALVVLPMPQDELPDSHLPGNLSLQDGILVINLKEAEAEGNEGFALEIETTAVPAATPLPQNSVQFTVLPNESSGLVWNLKMTGFYGSRWDVWERFLAGRVRGMNWETFKHSVLAHNTHLETDGFVFYPDKSYLLPLNQ